MRGERESKKPVSISVRVVVPFAPAVTQTYAMVPAQPRPAASRRGQPQHKAEEDHHRGGGQGVLQGVLQPLADEIERLQHHVSELEQALKAERAAKVALERRLQGRIAQLQEHVADAPPPQSEGSGAGSMVLPPPSHPFWKQADAASVAIRMLAESEANRLRTASQLETSLEARRALMQQLEALRGRQRSLQTSLLSLELRQTH